MRRGLGTVLATIGMMVLAAGGTTADRWGQPVGVDYAGAPGRVTGDADLVADAAREQAALEALPPRDAAAFDAHGGVVEPGRNFRATGFFRLEKVEGRWWFITPEGHRFFMVGCDACGCFEGGYATPTVDLEGRLRPEFAGTDLPSRTTEAEAWVGRTRVNFLVANLKRKYGTDFRRKSDETVRRRLRAWGFNATAKWGWGWKLDGVPYFEDASIRAGDLRFGGWPHGLPISTGRYVDYYHPRLAAEVTAIARDAARRRKGDRDLIAYALDNENGWDDQTLRDILTAPEGKAGSFARAAFYAHVARRRGAPVASVASKELSAFTMEERQSFYRATSKTYHDLATSIYHLADPDHLFIGAANCGSPSWVEGQAESSVDFIGMHEYSIRSVGWYRSVVDGAFARHDKPFAILEYSLTSSVRGMRPYNAMTDCVSPRARGLGYRNYVEHAAQEPLCLGFGYFIFYDQPFTRRQMNGENHNFGLVNQQDRPYADMVVEVAKSNARLFDLHAGRIAEPFRLSSFAGVLETVPALEVFRALVEPGSLGPFVVNELNAHDRTALFNGRRSHVKLATCPGMKRGFNEFGTIDLARHPAKTVEVVFICYRGGDGDTWPVFQVSRDGQTFEPRATRRRATWTGEHFVEWRFEVDVADARRLRLGLDVRDLERPWLALLGEIAFR